MADSPETSLITDCLTGVFNLRFFDAVLLKEVSRANRHQVPLTILLVDLDHLKEVNELHGHPSGDMVLKTLATILRSSIRQLDVVARYGGDEFAILLPHTDLRGGQMFRNRLQDRIHTADALSALQFKVSVTVGVCQYKIGEALETFIGSAEQALLRAKRGGDDDESSVPVFV
jgi:diguanylate cyclase (GGDEF)-like protein